MGKINKIMLIFVILIIVVITGLALKTSHIAKAPVNATVDSIESTDPKATVQERQVAGFILELENGTTEQEVNTILQNSNISVNYSIEYNTDSIPGRDYVIVDEDKRTEIVNEVKKGEEFPEPSFPFEVKKGNHYIILSEQGFENENFLKVMEENNLQVKKTIVCYIQLWDKLGNWMSETDANRIKGELERNKKVIMVDFDSLEGTSTHNDSVSE